MKYRSICILFIACLNIVAGQKSYQAVVVVPVADLVGQPLLTKKHSDVYHLPISGVDAQGCSRIHQVLFNEIVTVLEERGNEIRIRLSNIFYEQADTTTRYTEYWTHKHAVVSLDVLARQHIPSILFPAPINLEKSAVAAQQIVTLLMPHYDTLTQQTYSAGTRFIVREIKKNNIVVHAYSLNSRKICSITMPQHICLEEKPRSHQNQIALFTSLIQQWAQQQHGFIPYVLGGCSFTMTCNTNSVVKKGNAYYRPTYPNAPTSGLDCTGIIARATQICGIPYYFKNTTTLIKYVRPLEKQESIENGDIIWFAGHAIVIVNTAKNLCVEARSYDHGFGKIHALPVSKLFSNVHHLEDIKTAMYNNKPIARLDSNGNIVQMVPSIKILKLSSVWQHLQETHKA